MDIQIETRSRSRSKTPGLRRSVEPESREKAAPVRKDPSVSLIEEEKEEIPSSQEQKIVRPKRGRPPKVVTSDYSSDDVSPSPDSSRASEKHEKKTEEIKEKNIVSSTTTVVSSTTKIVTSSSGTEETVTRSVETSSVQTTNGVDETLKESGASEVQSLFGSMFNAIKTSTPIQLIKKSSRIANKLDPEVAKAHPAYKEYKEAGEYWNKYPKTDYTYSELSPHRREIAQGVVAMPNMSRKSLDKFQGRIETMIQKNPAQESFIRQRFLSRSYTQPKYSAELQYDSADEVDLSEFSQKTVKTVINKDSFLSKIFLFIINTFYACCYRARSIFYRKETSLYAATPTARVVYKRGFFGKCYDFIKSIFLRVVSKFYVLISSILFLDTWLLQTSAGSVENKKRKRFLLCLLLLLPILLFGGIYVYLDPPTFVIASLSGITLPSLPSISLPKISFPSLTWPSFKFPSFSLPALPTFTWPSLPTFSWPSLPTFSWPKIPTLVYLPTFPTIGVDIDEFHILWDSMKNKILSIFMSIKDATNSVISEAQIVWNENFNAN